MAGASNPAFATAAGSAMPSAGGGKGGGQAAVAPGPATAPQMAAPGQPNVFNQSAGAYNAALGMANRAGSAPAPTVGTNFGYNPTNVNAQPAVGGINTYMNPYTQQVIDRTQGDIARQQEMAMNQLGAQASQAGAFGGSRHGVAQGVLGGEFGRAFGDIAAQQRAQGFNTALGASQQDAAAQMQAAMANQAAGARAAEFGQSTGLQAALANQAALMQQNQLGLQAAGQLGSLSNLGFGFGTQLNQQQAQQGALQQGLQQMLIDAAKGQYGGFTGAPGQALNLPLAAVGAANMGQRSETQSYKPGLLDYLNTFAGMIPKGPAG
jgi:hypothetical protein